MNERRAKRASVLVAVLAVLTIGRIATQTNPVYDVLEPLFKPLLALSERLQSVQVQPTESNFELQGNDETGIAITRKNLQSFDKSVWINAGKDKQVQVGDTVTVSGVLFGRVIETYDSSSLVQTIIDPNFRATVAIGDVHGVLIIEFGSLIIDLVPRTTDSLLNSAISSDGLNGKLAVGVPIGEVGEESAGESDVFTSYAVRLPYNPYDVQFVEVLSSNSEENR